MSETTPKKAPRKSAGRSKITNGSLGDMDGRGKWARRFADLIELYGRDVSDVPATLPEVVKSIIRRAATMTVELERAEAVFAKDGKADPTALSEYRTTAGALRRILQDIQIKAGLSDPIMRPDRGRGDGMRVIRSFQASMTIEDHRLCDPDYGRSVARQLAFAIDIAKREGLPVSEEVAAFAVDLCLAKEVLHAQEESDRALL